MLLWAPLKAEYPLLISFGVY